MSSTVELRGTPRDLLHEVVAAGLPKLEARLAAHDRQLPRYVRHEVKRYLGCGDAARGFAWLTCTDCDHHRLVPFSCKGRGFCPACGGRRMAERAAAWVDGLFPHVAVRQWVLTVPFHRRLLLARRPDLARGVLAVGLRLVRRWMQQQVPAGRTGSVTVAQRFGSALNLNPHFHTLQLDGVYVRGKDRKLSFRRLRPKQEDVDSLVVQLRYDCEAWLAKQGFGSSDEPAEPEDDAQAVIQAASVAGQLATRGSRQARRTQRLAGKEYALAPLCAGCDGYTLHAGTVVEAADRRGLEHLARYVNRPPLAKNRLARLADGTVSVGMKRVFSDGTAGFVYTDEELVERLCSLVPPPRANQALYHGLFAANAGWRKEVVPSPPPETAAAAARRRRRKLSRAPSPRSRTTGWADLLARVFAVDVLACPHCQRPMQLRCVVVHPPASTRILRTLGAPRAPPVPVV